MNVSLLFAKFSMKQFDTMQTNIYDAYFVVSKW